MNKEMMKAEDLHIIKQELITVTEKLDGLRDLERDVHDLKQEIKGLKLFLGRVHPEFKEQFPKIMGKMGKTS